MATRRRDLTPRKDKTGGQSPSHTTNKATSNLSAKTTSPQNHDPTTPKKRSTSSPRLAVVRGSANGVHKQLVKTPTSLDSAHKPAHTARRTVDKTPLPAQKTRVLTKPPLWSRSCDTSPLTTQKRQVSTTPSLWPRDKTPLPALKKQVSSNQSLRSHDKTPLRQKTHVLTPSIQPRDKTQSPAQKTNVLTNSSLRLRDQTPLRARKTQLSPSPFPGKIIASGKTVSGKNSKALNKDDGRRSLHETPISTTLKTFQENVENLDIYQNLPEVEILLEDEPFTFSIQQEVQTIENIEAEEHFIKVVIGDENDDIIGLAPDENEEKPLYIAKIEAENHEDDDKGTKVVTIESSPVFEQEVSLDVNTQESEETLFIEEKLEEHCVQEIIDINKSVADDYHKDKVEEVEKEEKEKVSDKKEDEGAGESEVHESVQVKEPEVAEKQKQESENKAQTQGASRWTKVSVVSNNAIEETASKLRDQRISRVRALAGAFESVMQ